MEHKFPVKVTEKHAIVLQRLLTEVSRVTQHHSAIRLQFVLEESQLMKKLEDLDRAAAQALKAAAEGVGLDPSAVIFDPATMTFRPKSH